MWDFQDASYVPVLYNPSNEVSASGKVYPEVSVSAASKDGSVVISLVNTSLDEPRTFEVSFDSLNPSSVTGEILNSKNITDYNDFGRGKDTVKPSALKGIKVSGNTVKVTVPAASIAVLHAR